MAVIDFKTILSTFNEKGTLLKWLQKVEKALGESVLESVTVNTSGSTAVFYFNFANGERIDTPPVSLPAGPQGEPGAAGPQGEPGAAGVGIETVHTLRHYEQDGETITVCEVVLTNGETEEFEVHTENGADGEAGKSITEFQTQIPYPLEDYTETPVKAKYSDGTDQTFNVYAKNGAAGAAGRGVTTFGSGNPTTDPATPGYTVTPVTAVYTDGSAPSSFKVYAKDGSGKKYNTYSILLEISQEGWTGELTLNITLDDYYDIATFKDLLYIRGMTDESIIAVNGALEDASGSHYFPYAVEQYNEEEFIVRYSNLSTAGSDPFKFANTQMTIIKLGDREE